jgi:FixJ family two-component response regulator
MGSAERWSGSHVFIFYSSATRGCEGRPQSWRHLDACCNGCAARDEESVMVERSLVSVVDDDESVRESLPDLLREFGFAVQAFSSAEEFLASDCVGQTGCLILDIAMPGMSGPDLQRELALRRQEIPIVFITAHGDETVRPRMLEQGAVECLFKPFSDTALRDALNAAFRVS